MIVALILILFLFLVAFLVYKKTLGAPDPSTPDGVISELKQRIDKSQNELKEESKKAGLDPDEVIKAIKAETAPKDGEEDDDEEESEEEKKLRLEIEAEEKKAAAELKAMEAEEARLAAEAKKAEEDAKKAEGEEKAKAKAKAAKLRNQLENAKKQTADKKKCMYKKAVNGKCLPGWEVNDAGCCDPVESAADRKKAQRKMMMKMGKQMIKEELTTVMAKALIKRGGKMVLKLVGKFGAKILAKMAIKIVAKVGVKLAASAAKWAAYGSTGPVGAAMMLFDMLSMAVDIMDLGGYASFTKNTTNTATRNSIEYMVEKGMRESGMDYPQLFPVGEAFPKEYGEVNGMMVEHFMEDVMDAMGLDGQLPGESVADSKKRKVAFEAVGQAFAATLDENGEQIPGKEFQMPKEAEDMFGKVYDTVSKAKYKKRDQFIFDKMKAALGSRANEIQMYPSMSKPGTVGVSLSEVGMKKWNDSKRNEFFQYFDALKPKELPKDYNQPMVAIYTKHYRETDKAALRRSNPKEFAKRPVMIDRQLPQKVMLGGYYGQLVANCEKSRKSGRTAQRVHPYNHGVRFNHDTGTCLYTNSWCSKMGMKHVGGRLTDCKLRKGQKVAEMIFGTTVTRGVIKASNKLKNRAKDMFSGNPKKMANAALNTLLDPLGLGLPHVKYAKKAAKAAAKAAKAAAKAAAEGAKKAARAAGRAARAAAAGAQKAARAAARMAGRAARAAARGARDAANKAARGAARAARAAANAAKNLANKAARGARRAANAAARGARRAANKVGNAFKSLFRCFSPDTPIKLKNGTIVKMKDIKLDDVLSNGAVVTATMKIRGRKADPYYEIYSEDIQEKIRVTGSHYIKNKNKYCEVKDFPKATKTDEIDDELTCLVTSDHTIPVGEYTFWDWEDNLIPVN
jgi:hypothetical protein